MGFRGVLLTAHEVAGAVHGFRVVCPDAHLQLPTGGVPRDAPYVTEQKLLVTDFVTSELQQVTRVSSVTLERETRSALWVATVPSVAFAPEQSVLGGSTYPFDQRRAVTQVCYCFYFRAELEFSMFERAHAASINLLHYSLLANSLSMELDIKRDMKLQPAPIPTPKAKAAAAATPVAKTSRASTLTAAVPLGHEQLQQQRAQLRKELKELKERGAVHKQAQAIRDQAAALEAQRLKAEKPPSAETKRTKDSGTNGQKATATSAAKAEVQAETSPVECVLCGVDADCRGFAGTFLKHPYVLKDGRGSPVMICKSCLQRILKRRLDGDAGQKSGSTSPKQDTLCGLCADPVEQIKREVKACSHPQCPRVYCSPCLKKLFGKAQFKKVERTKNWKCPNCTPADDPLGERTTPTGSEDSRKDAALASTTNDNQRAGKKKRKRQPDDKLPVVEIKEEKGSVLSAPLVLDQQPPKPVVDVDLVVVRDPVTGAGRTLLDYATEYYEFLIKREEQLPPPVESEDVCLCCKDGGDVLECDWTHGGARCLKVYHQDCLGFKVSEEGKWLCPRHRCYKCGFNAHYACRFCVTSFCKDHLPQDVKKLGPATADIALMEYVLCAACDDMSLKAVEKGKISGDMYNRLLHPEPPKQRKASKPKKRTR